MNLIYKYYSKLNIIKDKGVLSDYYQWEESSRVNHIGIISLSMPFLYILSTMIEKSSWVSIEVQELMFQLHIFLISPIWICVGCFTLLYRSKWSMLVMSCVPVINAVCHSIIASQMRNPAIFNVEAYLMVIWIFIISGLTFRYAMACASIVTGILISTSFVYMENSEHFTVHVFWLFCSFFFGIFASIMYEKTRKQNFINLQALEKLATTDTLTGLHNRHQFNAVLTNEINRAARYQTFFSIVIIDIDHFKQINDNYGHPIGDKVLQQVAAILSDSILTTDNLYRWGGEEFILIALEKHQQNTIALCEKLRKKIENASFIEEIQVTISIGATMFKIGDSQNSLIVRADSALYRAKNEGRNRTVLI